MDKTYILAPIFGMVSILIALLVLFYALGIDDIYIQLTG